MASYLPCVKNNAAGYIFYIGLVSQTSTLVFQANPTLAAGDVKIAIDDGVPANLGTLPSVDADFTKRVKVTLSQAETNGDNLTIIFSDAAGAEWCDLIINIHTGTQTFDSTDTVTDAILADTGTDGVVVNAAGLAADAVDEILDEIVEGTITLRQAMRLLLAADSGKSAGGGTTTLTFQDIADSKARITATVDANGNRTAVTRDGT
jgi:hypothetical protein